MDTFLLLMTAYIAIGVALSCCIYVYTNWGYYRGAEEADQQCVMVFAGIFWPIGLWVIVCLSFFRYTKRWTVVRKDKD